MPKEQLEDLDLEKSEGEESLDDIFERHEGGKKDPVEEDENQNEEPAETEEVEPAEQEEPAEAEEAEESAPALDGFDQELWQSVPPAAQKAFAEREAAIRQEAAEAQSYRQQFGFVGEYYNQHRQAMAIHGVTPEQGLRQILALNDLAQQNPAEYLNTFQKLTGFDIADWVQNQQAEQDYLTPEQQQLTAIQADWNQFKSQQLQAQADQQIAAFSADPKNKFFGRPDVQAKVAEFFRRGVTRSLPEAYDMAVVSIPEVRQLMAQEAASPGVRSTSQAAEKAKRMATRKLPEQSVITTEAQSPEESEDAVFRRYGM